MTPENMNHYMRTEKTLIFCSLFASIWGAHHLWSDEAEKLFMSDRVFFADAFRLVNAMIWVRMIYLLFLGFLLVFLCIYLVCYLFCGVNTGIDYMRRSRAQLARLPLVNKFIEERARVFDPNNDHDKEAGSCAICLEDFKAEDSENQQVAELACSGKHIFHVHCLKEWVKNNDICPMCR